MKKTGVIMLCLTASVFLFGCGQGRSVYKYELTEVHPVSGRQGICTEDGSYWVSGSGTLAKYDSSWNLIAENTD
ncbi:MAG: hypothetical protein ACSW8K_12245, partial [bacterium]